MKPGDRNERLGLSVALIDVLEERERARRLHPGWPCDLAIQLSIISEEMGEAHKALVDYRFNGGEEFEVYREVCQVAATSLRLLEGWALRLPSKFNNLAKDEAQP